VDPWSDIIECINNAQRVEGLLTSLTPRSRYVIEHYFGLNGKPEGELGELARRWGLSRSRIWDLKTKALHRMRRSLEPKVGSGTVTQAQAPEPFVDFDKISKWLEAGCLVRVRYQSTNGWWIPTP